MLVIKDPSVTPSQHAIQVGNRSPEMILRQLCKIGVAIEASHVEAPVAASRCTNDFIGAALLAYAKHLPLVLDPADVWTLILQGVGIHLSIHGETYRHVFVEHKGQETLSVQRDHFVLHSPDNDWLGVFTELADKARECTHLREFFEVDWSTATVMSRGIQSLTLMNALSTYFKFEVYTCCGVPEYHILGTREEWALLGKKAGDIAHMLQMTWWKPRLERFFQAIDSSFAGAPSMDFWHAFVKEHHGSGGSTISGAILSLLPYEKDYYDKILPFERDQMASSFLSPGVVQVPFMWNYLGTEHAMHFVGGFVGVTQDPETFAVRPGRGFAVY